MMKFTLKGLLVLVGMVCLLAALAIPAIFHARQSSRERRCVTNLSTLWKMAAGYSVKFGDRQYSRSTGGQFWIDLTHEESRVIDPGLVEIFQCPFREARRDLVTDYRGPATDINTMNEEDAVGADHVGNHASGGTLLRKSGDVITVPGTHQEWSGAAETTRP